jgi:hypothetical protein
VQPWGFDALDAPGSRVLFVNAETATQRQAHPLGVPSRARPLDLHRRLALSDPVADGTRMRDGHARHPRR